MTVPVIESVRIVALSSTPLRWDARVRIALRAAAITEAVTWAGMLTGMLFKYAINGDRLGVTIAGWFHGIAWLVFVAACIIAAIRFRWRVWIAIVGVAISVFPLLTIPFDAWMERSGRLRRHTPVDASLIDTTKGSS